MPMPVGDDRIQQPQHKQTASFGPCAKQPSRMGVGQCHAGKRKQGGKDQYCERPRNPYLQEHAGMAEVWQWRAISRYGIRAFFTKNLSILRSVASSAIL